MSSEHVGPEEAAPERGGSRTSFRWQMVPLALAILMPSLDTSIANAGLPTLAEAFAATFQGVQWVVLAYLLTITALIVSVGRMGDLVGRKALLLSGIVLFTLASLLCGAASTLWLLLIGRGLQGIGAAIMMALSFAMVGEVVPANWVGRSMGLLGTMSAFGMTLGPSLGGFLIAAVGWRSIFLINIPIGMVTLMLARRFLPAARPSQRIVFDLPGTLLLATALTAYALALTLGDGNFGLQNAAFFLLSLVSGGCFVLVEAKAAAPMIRLETFQDRVLSAGLISSILVMTVLMTTLVVGPFYLSHGLGLTTAMTGLALSVGPLVAALSSVPAGRLVDRFGAQRPTLLGLGGIGAGALVLALMPLSMGLAGYLGAIALVTSSYALFQTANNTALIARAHPDHRGVTAGLVSLSRHLGQISGAAVMGAVFAFATGTSDVAAATASAIAAGMRSTYAVAVPLIIAALVVSISQYRRS